MQTVFIKLLNMSITASYLIIAIIVLRMLLKKAPKWIICALWALAAARLICPFSMESVLSLIPSTETIPQDILTHDSALSYPAASPSAAAGASAPAIVSAASVIWIIGMLAMLAFAAVSVIRIYIKVKEAVRIKDNIWLCDRIGTPFILGLFRPRIYLPSHINEADAEYVLLHEKAHLKRRDHLWKPLGFALLTLYWFNPLLWAAYILLCTDIELACDEKVIRESGIDSKKAYANALVNCSVSRKTITVCPLAFGGVSIKQRVKSVLHYKKPAFWIIIAAVIACGATAVVLMTNPLKTKVGEPLLAFIETQVTQRTEHKDAFTSVDCEILGVENSPNKTTVYMWVLSKGYSYSDDQLKEESAYHCPTVVSIQDNDGAYTLSEYWTPRDGSYYAQDIKAKFPLTLWSKAFDAPRYIQQQQDRCLKKAQEYFGVSCCIDASIKATLVKPTDSIYVSPSDLAADDLPEMKAEDNVRILETHPAKIDKVYAFHESAEPIFEPNVRLSEADQTFTFTWSMFSSYIASGKYEKSDTLLTLKSEGGDTYVFTIDGAGNLIFNANRSSPIPEYKYTGEGKPQSPVPDGAVFTKI